MRNIYQMTLKVIRSLQLLAALQMESVLKWTAKGTKRLTLFVDLPVIVAITSSRTLCPMVVITFSNGMLDTRN